MAKCDEGYLCDVCGQDVAELTDSEMYLRYIVGMLDPEVLHTTPERHIRCNPALAQYIVADDFPPVVVEGPFDKRTLDERYVGRRERLLTRGWRRFHLGELDDSKEYLQARVEFFDDDPQPQVDPALIHRAVELSASLAKVTGLDAPPEPPSEEHYPSYVLSNSLPLHVKFKQQILMSRSETERLTRFIDHIEELVPRLEATKRARKLAGTNGHPQ